jgi:nickel transport protein
MRLGTIELLQSMNRAFVIRLLSIALALGISNFSHAHGIQFDLEADGLTLRGTAVYTDQTPVARESVMFYSPPESESPVGSTITAADGRFSYEGSAGRTYRVAIDAGEGHHLEKVVTLGSAAQPTGSSAVSRTELDAALLPLREELAGLRRQWRLSDLIAGLGYLFGIYGLIINGRTRRS